MSLHNHAADDRSKRFSRAVGSRPALTFFARGDSGGERITFCSGGITGPYGDTASKPAITVDLTPGWKKYTINPDRLRLIPPSCKDPYVAALPGKLTQGSAVMIGRPPPARCA